MLSLPLFYRRALGALLLLAAGLAQAQYVWIGPNGTRQYSDRPPPAGTPPGKILKSPGRAAPAPAPVADGPADAPAKPAETKAPPTVAEREAAYRERSKTREDELRKQQEATLRQRQLAERCAAARETQAQLASGIRIAQVGQDGQRSYMSDEERAARGERVRRDVQECRQAAP